MRTRFSEAIIRNLARIATLEPDVRARIPVAVSQVPAKLYPFEDIAKAVQACIPSTSATEEDDESIGDVVASFIFVAGASTQSQDELLGSALEQLQEVVSDVDQRGILAAFLRDLLGASSLLIASKATALYEENERLILDSRLMVDVRPIFDVIETQKIAATTLLYKLRLAFRGANGSSLENQTFTLRQAELEELQAAVNRAVEKAAVIRNQPPFGVQIVESKK